MEVYGIEARSRLLLGTAQYPSPAILADAVEAARAEVVTVSLRRESGAERAGQGFWSIIRELGVRVLPNTAGCHSGQGGGRPPRRWRASCSARPGSSSR